MWLFLFALWIVLNGRVTVELVIFGVVIASAVTFFANRIIGYSSSIERRLIRNFPVFLIYILNLIWEIIVSAFKMCDMVYSAKAPEPVIIEFHSGFQTQLQNVLLANSITLTPGTITLFQEGDHFVVHCLRGEFGEGIEESSFVKLLRKIK
jgi:multicomponent Na+:H+ antiporter subunit E